MVIMGEQSPRKLNWRYLSSSSSPLDLGSDRARGDGERFLVLFARFLACTKQRPVDLMYRMSTCNMASIVLEDLRTQCLVLFGQLPKYKPTIILRYRPNKSKHWVLETSSTLLDIVISQADR